MRLNVAFKGNYAVSEVVGGMMMVLVAVIAFSVVYLYLIPSGPEYEPSTRIEGVVSDDGNVILKHVGGNSLTAYKIVMQFPNGTTSSIEYTEEWNIGECIYPLENVSDFRLVNESVSLNVDVYCLFDDRSFDHVFNWQPVGNTVELRTDCPILISSLKTNTVDEDLICYSYPVIPNINATTYVYNWKVNGIPLCDLNMPFATEDNTTSKDYSGYGLDGTMTGATWVPNGIIGGACYFGGSSEYLSTGLPQVFNDIPNNDFTVSIWVKSGDIAADNAIVLMASKDHNNFMKIFLQGNEIHMGVCDDGTKDAVRTDNLTSDTWYHIVGVWDASEDSLTIYCNGEEFTIAGERNFAMGSQPNVLEIGHGTASSKFWDGFMDELEIYHQALSQEQIYQIYLSTKEGDYSRRITVSEETNVGEYWQCIVTPNDVVEDDDPVPSNILQIVNHGGGD